MKLIINRIYRQIGNVFEELQRKVMREDLMRQRKNAENFLEDKKANPLRKKVFNDENNGYMTNQSDEIQEDIPQKKSQFRQIYEMKKQKFKAEYEKSISDHYSEYDQEEIKQRDKMNNNQKQYDNDQEYVENHIYHYKEKERLIDRYQAVDEESVNYERNDSQNDEQFQNQKKIQVLDMHHYYDDKSLSEPEVDPNYQSNRMINDVYHKKAKKSQQQFLNNQIIDEEQDSFQISPQKIPLQEIYQNEEQEQIIKPAKKIQSYLNQDIQDKYSKNKGVVVKSNRQQNVVEMSFSENPFDKRQSSMIHASNQTISSNPQNSPDFKGGDASMLTSFNQNLKRDPSLKSVKSSSNIGSKVDHFHEKQLNHEHSLSKISEISSDLINQQSAQNKKNKFSEKLQMIMTQLNNKNNTCDKQSEEMGSIEISNFGDEKVSSNELNGQEQIQKQTRLQSLKKKIQNLNEDKSESKQLNEIRSGNQIETALGTMIKISENEIIFEERRQNRQKLKGEDQVQQKQQQLSSIKVKSKKNVVQSQQQKVNYHEDKLNSESQDKDLEKIQINLDQKESYNIQERQIQEEKKQEQCLIILSISNKIRIRRAFKQFQIIGKQIKAQSIIKSQLITIAQYYDRRLQKAFLQWRTKTQLIHQQRLITQREKTNTQLSLVFISLKHKYQQNLKFALYQIKRYQQIVIKNQQEQNKNRSVQKIAQYLKQKEQLQLSKQFQKYKKLMFLYSFELKLIKMSQFFSNKLNYWKKESFKQIIGFCLKNEAYKKQIELLNQENKNAKNILVKTQISRIIKIAKTTLLKQGFQSLNYNNRIQCLKIQSVKKIKVLIAMNNNKQQKQKFEIWKHEASQYINNEVTKIAQEKENQRNTKLEQIFVNIWWSALSKGFFQIKRKSNLVKCIQLLQSKKQNRDNKFFKQEAFKCWKQLIFTQKLYKISLQVVFKLFQNKTNQKINYYFKKWLRCQKSLSLRNMKIMNLILKKIQKYEQLDLQILEKSFLKLKAKYYLEKIMKQKLQNLIEGQGFNYKTKYFLLWKNDYLQQNDIESKTINFTTTLTKVQMRFKLRTLNTNAKQLTAKRNASQLFLQLIKNQSNKNLRYSLNLIKQISKTIEEKIKQQKQASRSMVKIQKTFINKQKQRFFAFWKINAIEQHGLKEMNKITRQFQLNLLGNLLKKKHKKYQQQAVQKWKQILIYEYQRQIKMSQKEKQINIACEKLRLLVLKRKKSYFNARFITLINDNQNKKVTITISKLASATKISEMIQNKRSDRYYFYKWRRITQIGISITFGSEILKAIFQKVLYKEFTYLKTQTHLIQIHKARRRLGLNMLKVLLYKLHKEQVSRSFNLWLLMQNKTKFGNRKPPKPNLNDNQQVATVSVTRIFNNSSKVNSANNSFVNQSFKNMRYSNQGSDEEELEQMNDNKYLSSPDQLNKSTNQQKGLSRQSSLDIIITEEKLHENDNQQIGKYHPSTQRNQTKTALFFFNGESSPGRVSGFDNKIQTVEVNIMPYQNDQQFESLEGEKESKYSKNSRNKSSSLNKYINNNTMQSKQSKRKKEDYFSTQRSTTQSYNNNQEDYCPQVSCHETIQEGTDTQSLNQTRLFSPRSTLSLEPVPEEPYKKEKKDQKKRNLTQSKHLKNFINTDTNKEKIKEQLMQKKQISIENQKKYSVFLNAYKNKNEKKEVLSKRTKEKINKSKNLEKKKEGLNKLENVIVKNELVKAMEKMIVTVFDPEYNQAYHERKKKKQLKILKRVGEINEGLKYKQEYRVWEAFTLWKRLDFISMLNSLQQFKNELNKLYS